MLLLKSTQRIVTFLMVDSSDHVTGKTDLSPTVTVSKNGASFGASANSASEISSGLYKITLTSTETNTVGQLTLHATSAGADACDITHDVANSITSQLTQSVAYKINIFMADSSDHITGKTSLSPTVTISKNGGSFGSISGSVAELASGWYTVSLAIGDTDTTGDLVLHATATGADPTDYISQVVAATTIPVVSSVASTSYAPAYLGNITITANVTNTPDLVVCTCNDRSVPMTLSGGTTYTTGSVVAGATFGAASSDSIYVSATKTSVGGSQDVAPSSLTVAAITQKTATLISEVGTSLTGAGYTATITLENEKEVGATIVSLLKISVATYSVATLDGIRTTVTASKSGWSGSVTATEVACPLSSTHSIIYYKMSHS